MGEVSRPLPTSPAPASLRAAGASGTVDIRTDGLPTIGAPDSPERWQADWPVSYTHLTLPTSDLV